MPQLKEIIGVIPIKAADGGGAYFVGRSSSGAIVTGTVSGSIRSIMQKLPENRRFVEPNLELDKRIAAATYNALRAAVVRD
ncbi:MAG TPA: hypothetical protein VMU27_03765 [Candidatus Paceibacterota bacterium]|nr:hypothetical protein [Candidatus Paceibacterota bacterium]